MLFFSSDVTMFYMTIVLLSSVIVVENMIIIIVYMRKKCKCGCRCTHGTDSTPTAIELRTMHQNLQVAIANA